MLVGGFRVGIFGFRVKVRAGVGVRARVRGWVLPYASYASQR